MAEELIGFEVNIEKGYILKRYRENGIRKEKRIDEIDYPREYKSLGEIEYSKAKNNTEINNAISQEKDRIINIINSNPNLDQKTRDKEIAKLDTKEYKAEIEKNVKNRFVSSKAIEIGKSKLQNAFISIKSAYLNNVEV
jgi:hypothetical protein